MFKSALGYFSAAATGQNLKEENEFVGQTVALGIFKLRIVKVIAEGGFGFVFLVQDTNTGKSFALKRMFSVDQESADSIEQEIRVLKQLNGHPNIIEFCASATTEGQSGRKEYLILTELCPGGVVVDALNKGHFPIDKVLKVFYQCCSGVMHMHTQERPITHRDLKLENLLIAKDGMVKLCDFGSSTTTEHVIDSSWTALKRSLVEDEVQRNTTPMYRAPECLDTYDNHPIDHRLDIWALGCILYVLCYRQHPFADAAKLAIVNAKYNIPANDSEFVDLQPLIREMLTIDPTQRPSVQAILRKLEVVGQKRNIRLNEPPFPPQSVSSVPAPVAPEPITSPPAASGQTQEGPNLINSLRGGAGSLFKKLGDTSSKVIQIAQQSIGKSELDIHYITNRMAVMSYPAEGLESAYRNHIEDVRAVLEARHQNNYMVVNISGRSYTNNKFPGVKVIERLWNQKKAPSIDSVLELCHSIYTYLSGKRNAVVIHCLDGKQMSAQLVSAFLIYSRVFSSVKDSLSMFAVKRFPVSLSPAQQRYQQYICDAIRHKEPHGRFIEIRKVSMSSAPMFTKARDGCRPFVNVYIKEECVYSTCLEYEKLDHYSSADSSVDFAIPNVKILGDVTIVINHARASTFAKGRIQAIPMAQIQFYTGYIEQTRTTLRYTLDQIDLIEEPDRYAESFEITMDIRFLDELVPDPTSSYSKYLNITTQPKTPFASDEEMNANIEQFRSKNSAPIPSRPPPPPAVARPATPPSRPTPPRRPDAPLITTTESVETQDLLNLGGSSKPEPVVEHQPTQSNCDDLLSSFEQISCGASDAAQAKPLLIAESGKSADLNDLDPFGLNTEPTTNNKGFQPQTQKTHHMFTTPSTNTANNDIFGSWDSFMTAPTVGVKPQSVPKPTAAPVTQPSPTGNFGFANFTQPRADNGITSPKVQSPMGTDKKPIGENTFDDLLGSQGFANFGKKENQTPKTMGEMKRKEMAKEMDPDQLLIFDWTKGKERNIRALLCSLHQILWPDARWSEIGMHQLVGVSDVKKQYRKACLAVHPDKLVGTEKEELAKLIFVELNDAWSEFEKQQGLS